MLDALSGTVASSFERAPWGWGVLVILLGFFVRLRPIMAKLASERETSLLAARAQDNDSLRQRVEALERRLDDERRAHDAERAVDRHRINNLTQCLDALLMLLEMAPDKAGDHVARIKEMRERQASMESVEKATITAAVVTMTGPAS